MDAMEEFYRNAVKRGEFRVVRNSKRRRKLLKRGENVRWSWFFNAWVWDYWKAHDAT